MIYPPFVAVDDLASKKRMLGASRLFSRLDDRLVEELARGAVRRAFARGDIVWRAGDPAREVTLIVSGLVEITRRNPDGTSAIVAIFGPREPIGVSAVVARAPYPADAVAASEKVVVLSVDANVLLERAGIDPAVSEAIGAELIEHTRALNDKIRIMTAGSVPQRLATLLLHLADRFGDEAEDGRVVVPVALSRAELAQLVGATVETTIRVVSAWQKEGLFATKKDGFVLADPAALAKLASGA